MQTDFIVIGSGLAGLTSSLVLSQFGKVLLVTKGKLSDGSTNWAQGGIACVTEEGDSWKNHLEDTLNAGDYHSDKKAVELLVKNAPTAIDWLSKQGVPFEKIQNKYKTGREGGHSYNRIVHASDFTGKEIELALLKKIRENKNITIWEDSFAHKLLIEKKKCSGVQILKKDKIIYCYSELTILATGGLGQVYAWTTNPTVSTGDGYALAYQAGAKLKDMEFVQFHPTALKQGESPLFLLSEALRGEGAYLKKFKVKSSKFKVTGTGERFMGDYDQRLELAPRDIVARAIFREQQNGYKIYLDIRHKDRDFLKKRFPNIYNALKKRGFDLSRDLIPVTPAAHFSCGGVETDFYGRTNIDNLFAFGEVACTGVHGANRLASNSLLEAVVFPLQLSKMISGKSSMIRIIEQVHLARLNLVLEDNKVFKRSPTSLINLRNELQQLMWHNVGIVRRKKDLLKAKGQLELWEKGLVELDYSDRELLELKNMILVAKFITRSAIKRKKSLGAHFMVES